MLPLQKDWALARARNQILALARGEMDDHAYEDLIGLKGLAEMGKPLLKRLGPIDIDVQNIRSEEGKLIFDGILCCRICGDRGDLDAPYSDNGDGEHAGRVLRCHGCGTKIGRWKDQIAVASWLAFGELKRTQMEQRRNFSELGYSGIEDQIAAMVADHLMAIAANVNRRKGKKNNDGRPV